MNMASRRHQLVLLALILMAGATTIFLVVDFLRLHLNPFKDIFVILFGSLLRRREFSSLTGGSYLMLASLVCMAVFGSGSFGTGGRRGPSRPTAMSSPGLSWIRTLSDPSSNVPLAVVNGQCMGN